MSVLDLPIEKQEELAGLMGQTHAEWLKGVQQRSAAAKKFNAEVEARESNLTPDEIKHMQAKVDSGNPD